MQSDEYNLVPDPKHTSRLKKISGVVRTEEVLEYSGREVYKIGRTTRFTAGTFSAIETTQVSIKLPNNRIYIYSNVYQVQSQPGKTFSKGGDSGAVVYTADFKALGLVVGGNDNYSWISPLDRCMEAMHIDLLV